MKRFLLPAPFAGIFFLCLLPLCGASGLIDLHNGHFAAVRNSAEAPNFLARIEEREDTELLAYDRVTGIILCQSTGFTPLEVPGTRFAGISSTFAGNSLYLKTKDGFQPVARTVGVEKRKGGKILPLSYIRFRTAGVDLPSGAVLYNKEGQMVGLVYINDRLIPSQGYAVPIQALLRVSKDFTKNKSVTRSWIGIVTTDTTNVPEVASVRPNSPAALAGIRKGDILVQVGEWPVQSYLDAVNAFYYLIAGEASEFSLMRGAELVTFSVTPIAWESLQGR